MQFIAKTIEGGVHAAYSDEIVSSISIPSTPYRVEFLAWSI